MLSSVPLKHKEDPSVTQIVEAESHKNSKNFWAGAKAPQRKARWAILSTPSKKEAECQNRKPFVFLHNKRPTEKPQHVARVLFRVGSGWWFFLFASYRAHMCFEKIKLSTAAKQNDKQQSNPKLLHFEGSPP